jgi:hypothetical protein
MPPKPKKKRAAKRTPAAQAAKLRAMQAGSRKSASKRLENILSGSANTRIRAHARAAHRAAQRRRDSKNYKSP